MTCFYLGGLVRLEHGRSPSSSCHMGPKGIRSSAAEGSPRPILGKRNVWGLCRHFKRSEMVCVTASEGKVPVEAGRTVEKQSCDVVGNFLGKQAEHWG